MKNEARGESLSQAKRLAQEIEYNYTLEGNKLILPSHFVIKKGEKYRNQEVFIIIKVPEGMYVQRNDDVSRNIYDVSVDDQHKFPWYRSSDQLWRMGPNGMIAPEYVADYKKEFNLYGFSKIRMEGDIKLTIKKGNFKILLHESDSQNEVNISQSGDRLTIFAPDNYNETYELEITMPDLEELWVIQSDDIEIKEFELDNLHIVNEGNGRINAFADIKYFDVQLTGDNQLDIRGEGDYLNAILTDDAELDAEHFTVKKANLELDNGSLAKVAATDTLWQKVINSEVISRRAPVLIEKN